jgi:hypothetical protein
MVENWKEAFNTSLGDDGRSELAAWVTQRDREHADHLGLVRAVQHNVGRPHSACSVTAPRS